AGEEQGAAVRFRRQIRILRAVDKLVGRVSSGRIEAANQAVMALERRRVDVPAQPEVERQFATYFPVILHVRCVVALHGGGQRVVIGAVIAASGKNAQQERSKRISAEGIAGIIDLLRKTSRGLKA